MQKVICALFLLVFSASVSMGQTFQFETPKNIQEGPFVEVTENGYNVYSWFSRSGFKSDKIGKQASINIKMGAEPVKVKILEVQSYSASGESISKEHISIRLDDVSLSKKYQVGTSEKIGLPSNEVFATNEDPTYDEVTQKFPNSTAFSTSDISQEKEIATTLARVKGKGMMGDKKPYKLTISKGDSDKPAVELADIPADHPDAEWKNYGTSLEIDEQNVAVPVWYNKWIKKDRFNQYKDFKLVIYTDQGKVIQEKEMNFNKPFQIYRTTAVTTPTGEFAGQMFFLGEVFGMGFKKVNPEPDKRANKLIFVSNDGQTIEEIALTERMDKYVPGSPEVISAIKTDQGIRLYLHTDGRKKAGVETGMEEYLCKDQVATLVKTHNYESIVTNSSGKHSYKFAKSIKDFEIHQPIANNNTLHIGTATTSLNGVTTAKDCNYIITNAEGSITQLGEIGIGNVDTSNTPKINVEEVKTDRLLITVDHLNLSDRLWLFNTSSNDFTKISPKTTMEVKQTIRRGDVLHYIGLKEGETGNWVIEQFDLSGSN